MAAKTPVSAASPGAKRVKKSSTTVKKTAPSHPPYLEMITEAIATLKERNGSSSQAIAKFIEEKYKTLPANYKKLLSNQLKKNAADGKLVKVKASFKLPSKVKPTAAAAPAKKAPAKKAPVKKAPIAAKPKAKAPAAKPKAVVAPKAKAAAKPNAAAKPKVAAKPSAKTAKTSTKKSPGKAVVAKKVAAPKKTAVKKMAVKKAAAPKKAAAAKKVKK